MFGKEANKEEVEREIEVNEFLTLFGKQRERRLISIREINGGE